MTQGCSIYSPRCSLTLQDGVSHAYAIYRSTMLHSKLIQNNYTVKHLHRVHPCNMYVVPLPTCTPQPVPCAKYLRCCETKSIMKRRTEYVHIYGVASMYKPSVIKIICLPKTLVVSVIALSATSKHFLAGIQKLNSPHEPTEIHHRSDRYIVTFNE